LKRSSSTSTAKTEVSTSSFVRQEETTNAEVHQRCQESLWCMWERFSQVRGDMQLTPDEEDELDHISVASEVPSASSVEELVFQMD
jgi:hypothetical protein